MQAQVAGWRAAHQALLCLSHALMWRSVSSTLDLEALAGAGTNNFILSLAKKVRGGLEEGEEGGQGSGLCGSSWRGQAPTTSLSA